ncbi:hypothetical protein [Luteitalea sp.]|uniref:hypothetical protein n=1 Tax=Luteitalea sp. TaxID=2004800 RepID=UPI0025BDAE95|nr:hypothetical protein [Luteitalea sp.]
MESAAVPLPTAHGQRPDFHVLGDATFQELCRDLYRKERNISAAQVFGPSGQAQFGVDVQAQHRNDDGISVGQCKCIVPQGLTVGLVQKASGEFLQHLEYWRERGVRRFILFVSPDASKTQINEEYQRQRTAFRELGFDYELWGQAELVTKLRPHPDIVRTYLLEYWAAELCGTGITGFPQDTVLINRVLHEQTRILAGHVSADSAAEVERLRALWREGKSGAAADGLGRLRDPGRWQAFPDALQATIRRFEGQLALDSGDLPRAHSLADEADALAPGAGRRLRALIVRREAGPAAALPLLAADDDLDTVTLKAGLLLESGQVVDAINLLTPLSGTAEVHRLRALAHVFGRDMLQARLEIDKASELAPTWVSVLYSRAIVYYLSGVSPAAVPAGLPSWPEPEPWEFVRTDDTSRDHFARAAHAITQIDLKNEDGDERRVHESWRLAALANDPERREEAVEYCRELLNRDPGHYQALVWGLARRLDVDFSASIVVLQERVAAGNASVPEIVALVLLRVEGGNHAAALELLDGARLRFVDNAAESLWSLWKLQVTAAAGAQPEASDASPASPQAQLVRLRARASSTGVVDELLAELQDRHDAGDAQASFELCKELGLVGRWEDAASLARGLTASVGTANALSLAAVTLYNAGDFSGALELLETHLGLFPHGEPPNDMRRLRLLARRRMGMLPAAATEAEDLFRRQPTQEHFLLLADVRFQMGDLHALAALARSHDQFPGLSAVELLRLAMRTAVEDQSLARGLWHRAASIGFADHEVVIAVDAGYRLGLDRDLRTLIQRMMQLAGSPGAGIQRYGLEDIQTLLIAQRHNAERVSELYRTGRIPIHLLAHHFQQPVSSRYRRAMLANQQSGHSAAGPVFSRAGWRTIPVAKFESSVRLRLHADTTALMTAHHFGLLTHIESVFAPILLPHGTPVALAHMRDMTLPPQPARRAPLKAVRDALVRGAISIVQDSRGSGFADKRLLDVAATNQWLLLGSLPLSDAGLVPLALTPEDHERVRTAHCVVDALKGLGELSEGDAAQARDALGPEHGPAVIRHVPRGANILCTAGVLEGLAGGAALQAATRTFSFHVLADDYDTFVVQPLEAFDVSEADALWLTGLLDQINTGLQRGTYQLLPLVTHDGRIGDSVGDSPTFGCLMDLLRLAPKDGDVLWVDDRWATRYVHKDGAPILGTHDVVRVMHERGAIPDERVASFVHDSRDADLRFISLTTAELSQRTRQALDASGTLHESRELRTIRRQFARSVAGGDDLVVAEDGVGPVEWPYILESSRAVVDAMVEVWAESEPSQVSRHRSEWLLRSLYIPDRGRQFTRAPADPAIDHHLEAMALVSLISHAIRLASTDQGEQKKRRAYLEWIHARLIRRRLEADPKLASTVIELLKESLLSVLEPSLRRKHARLAKLMLRQLVADLPEEMSARLADDPGFLKALDVEGIRQFRIGPHYIKADSFWRTAAEVARTGEQAAFDANGHQLLVKRDQHVAGGQLVVADASDGLQYLILSGELDILGDTVAAREAMLRRLTPLFDRDKADTDTEVARVALLDSAAERVMEVARLRRTSAASHYLELENTVSRHEAVDRDDFVLEDVEALTRHLRLKAVGGAFSDRLKDAAAALLDEVGLRETIVRLSGLPCPLPDSIERAVADLSSDGRRAFLGDLSKTLGTSPIASAHVAHLCERAGTERPVYRRYVRRWAKRASLAALDLRSEAWRKVLRVIANELAYVEAFRRLPTDERLTVVWTHGDRVFRILVNAHASEEWIRDSFGSWSDRLPAEVAFTDAAYLAECCHPRHLDLLSFSLDVAAYALGDAGGDATFRAQLSQWVEAEPARLLALRQQAGWRPDSMSSLLGSCATPARQRLLTSDLAERVSPPTLLSQVEAALAALANGDMTHPWVVLRAVVNDQTLPHHLVDQARIVIGSLDLVALCRDDVQVAAIAAVFGAQHASRLGADIVERVRSQLADLARECQRAGVSEVQVVEVLLSCPFYLFATESGGRVRRFEQIAKLLEELIQIWPATRDGAQVLLDRLTEGLPNEDARFLWGLQVKLRALR